MGQYCDTKVLEANWFDWLLSAPTSPILDAYRDRGFLLTKVLGTVRVETPSGDVKTFPDPIHKVRAHCVIVEDPVFFNSYDGRLSKPVRYVGSRPTSCRLPVMKLDTLKNVEATERLVAAGYRVERPVALMWHSILTDVGRMCQGIASKLTLPSDDVRADLASDALLQVSTKIRDRRLIYTPGRAPVFNLLTTTIHRIMFSLLNRDAKARQNAANAGVMLQRLAVTGRPHGRRIITVRRFGSLVACATN